MVSITPVAIQSERPVPVPYVAISSCGNAFMKPTIVASPVALQNMNMIQAIVAQGIAADESPAIIAIIRKTKARSYPSMTWKILM